MILLLINSEYDTTPEKVMDWLSFYIQDFKRLHAENYSNWGLKNIKKVSAVWFWRWGFVKGLPQTIATKTVFGGTGDNGIINGNCTPDSIGDEIRKKSGL